MKSKLLKYNLQFFAEDTAESVETPEVAETVGTEETEGQETAEVEQTQESEEKTVDVNAIAAAARRQAEADSRSRQAKIDAEFEKRFGNFKNPITGQPIKTQADYLAALDAQSQMQAEEQLRQNGVDPGILQQLISNNPAIRQAEEVIMQARQQEVTNQIMADVNALSELDSNITTLEDVPEDVIKKAIDTGLNLVDAYKLVNYGKVASSKQEAIQQAAINQAKNKQHMAPVNGVATNDGLQEIPADQVDKWKAFFPDASPEELKKKYNRVHK